MKRSKIHRKIYEEAYGPIQKGFHIHHIDGNRDNNDLSNLVALSPKDHYELHKKQGDWACCLALVRTGHLEITPEERSFLAKQQMSDPTMKKILSETMKETNKKIWSNTQFRKAQSELATKKFTKLWSNEEYKKRVSKKISQSWTKERKEKLSKEFSEIVTKNNNKELTCPYCGKIGKGVGIMNRWHFDNCKQRSK